MNFPKAEFNKASVKDANLNKGLLADLFNEIEDQKLNVHSMVLLREGSRVFRASAHDYTEDTRDEVYSISKSFTSLAIGILIDMNLLTLEDFVLFFFQKDVKNYLPAYEKLQVKHLLSMTVGQENDIFPGLTPSDNFFELFFNQPIVNEIGTKFFYNNMATFMLSAIVTKVTGKSLNDFLDTYLYSKIGIEKPQWKQVDNINFGATGLEISANDMAKFGLLLLNDGMWDGEKIVSKEYLDLATKLQVETPNGFNSDELYGYGYHFWLNRFGDFRAVGFKGQLIIINKKYNLVFACKSADERSLVYLFEKYILEATKLGWEVCDYSLRDFIRKFKSNSTDLIMKEKELN